MHFKKISLGLLATCCLASGSAWADSIADLKTWLQGTRTLKADFAQTSAGGIGGGKSQGTMAISRPGKFRWSINKPYSQLMVGDGSRIWLYDPELKQVIVRKSEKALGGTPAALLAGDNDAEQRFTFKADGEHAGGQGVMVAAMDHFFPSRDAIFSSISAMRSSALRRTTLPGTAFDSIISLTIH